jgi:hypothetical protein
VRRGTEVGGVAKVGALLVANGDEVQVVEQRHQHRREGDHGCVQRIATHMVSDHGRAQQSSKREGMRGMSLQRARTGPGGTLRRDMRAPVAVPQLVAELELPQPFERGMGHRRRTSLGVCCTRCL